MDSMETWDTIRARRNVRTYTDQPLPDEGLDRILEAGRRTPSSRNWQPWDLVVVTDRQQLADLATVWVGAGHVARSAATVALVAPADPTQREDALYDLGQLTISMMLAAADQGIGSGHANVSDQERAREILGLPADRLCAYLVAFGYPGDGPLRPLARPARRQFDDVVHRGGW